MRVLLDENLPHDLIFELDGLDVVTVQGLGWAGVKNGELLRRAAGHVAAFVTMDRKLEREHDLTALSFGVVVIRSHSTECRTCDRSSAQSEKPWPGFDRAALSGLAIEAFDV